MSQRFYSEMRIAGERIWLDGDQAHHLLHVMRAGVGDEVVVFDGAGGEYSATVETCERSRIELAIVEMREADRELAFSLRLGVALPKGDRQRWLVEKCVELGVSRLTPLVTSRGVAQPTGKALDRLRRAVIEACKQCGRNRLMEIGPPQESREFFSDADGDSRRLLADPGGEPPQRANLAAASSGLIAAIGPEGGWTDAELDDGKLQGWTVVSLGPRILRIETAAVAIAALASGLSGDANSPSPPGRGPG